ncbi:hypothetical protein D3C87_1560990 [compost metagenome]
MKLCVESGGSAIKLESGEKKGDWTVKVLAPPSESLPTTGSAVYTMASGREFFIGYRDFKDFCVSAWNIDPHWRGDRRPILTPPVFRLTIRLLLADGGGVEASGYDCACSSSLPCAGLVGEEDRPGAACFPQHGAQDTAV